MELESAERIINENRGGIVVQAFISILENTLEDYKRSLLHAESQIVRGKGQMCEAMINKLKRNFSDEESLDT